MTLIEQVLCAGMYVQSGYTRIVFERDFSPFWWVTENLGILVSAQSDKATGFVVRARDKLGQSRSPNLPRDDNHVFPDRARGKSCPAAHAQSRS